ncbi:hypothetical protein PPUJ20005_28020 [Pseudomonas putida]|uniref:virulence factor SrfC family protein n=1 Tax=Pseudomonas putida TaxID=303 RepID=UPI00235DC0D5|nr:virulence factor SrfC family protein [Pseudomonas putida]GLO08833.1 hypothetical protein PPUJ20005_28020 [Pseudomonas putida]HDS0985915.1 hypothetical protein [Pseudomonas putida]
MSDLTPKQQQLMGAWGAIHKGAGEALEWIEQVRGNAASVEAEADGLGLRLRRARNRAKNLQRSAASPMAVGFFGLSQAGKSYLISALASDGNGKLESNFGGQVLDFIQHVNPPGGGGEATGLVTRFSHTSRPCQNASYPVELKLFSEIEIAKILCNTWFDDFDHERMDYSFTEQRIRAALSDFEGQETGQVQAGVSSDDVVALWDYLKSNYEKSTRLLDEHYWPRAVKLAPRLAPRERAKLFSVLWGGQSPITDLYNMLAGVLQRLGHAETVYAPVSVFKQETDGVTAAPYNIMSVDVLSRLDTRRDQQLQVLPCTDGKLQASVGVTIAQLATLAVEVNFSLLNRPTASVAQDVEILDFPGYRTRNKYLSIDEAALKDSADEVYPYWNLILRGKVAYLFERYSEAQEMNALVVCTSTMKQSDVISVAPVLTRWIHNTQGATPKERGQRAPGLIWALTMCDGWINGTLGKEDTHLIQAAERLMKITIIERFGSQEWMKEWSVGKPFDNTYMVRKPRLKETAFIERDEQGQEHRLIESYVSDIQRLRQYVVDFPAANRHVADTGAAFDAMITLNDGGISRFSTSFSSINDLDFKLARIEEQLEQCRTDLLDHGLNTWREEDFEQLLNKKREKTQYLLDNLGADPDAISELIHALQVPVEQLRELYLGGVYDIDGIDGEAGEEPEPAIRAPANKAPALNFGNVFGNTASATPAAAPKPVAKRLNSEQRFVRAALKAWIKHMRELGTQPLRLSSLRMSREVVEALVEELVSAVRRPAFIEQLDAAAMRRIFNGVRRDQMVQRQVLTVQLAMRDFLSWFDLLGKPVSERPTALLGESQPVFGAYQTFAQGELPVLPKEPSNQEQSFQIDWLSSLAWLTQENAKSGADPEITTEQRRQLAVLLNTFQAS